MQIYKKIVWLILFFISVEEINGQISVSGIVSDSNNQPLMGATVLIKDFQLGVMTDDSGYFIFSKVPVNAKELKVNFLGYESKILSLNLKSSTELKISLKNSTQELGQVVIKGKTQLEKRKEAPVQATIINTERFKEQSATVTELINRSPGIRVRQSGGMGSTTQINLNGFQGNSIRVFKDGIPTDYLGTAYSIGVVPTNTLQGIEVYKGILPSDLGADALGGALNLVSSSNTSNRISTSYEIASFNTHRATVNANLSSKSNKLYGGLEAFVNYSDNNYDVNVNYVDAETANEVPITTKLFHNTYRQHYVEFFMGLRNLKWVDDLKISVTNFKILRENQFGQLMQYPIGAAYNTQTADLIPSLRYKKQLFKNKLKFDQFLAYSKITRKAVDTLNGSYDWLGDFTANTGTQEPGETESAYLITMEMYNAISRTTTSYRLNKKNNITLNAVYNKYNQKGTNPYGEKTEGDNPVYLISLPADYNKLVTGLALDSDLWNQKLRNSFQIKYYNSESKGLQYDINTGQVDNQEQSASISNYGIANAIKYKINPNFFLRLSGEQAIRLPTQSEIFGNGVNILANFNLKPEQSTNVNLGLNLIKENKYLIDMNLFYRNTKDMILTSFTEKVFYGTSENLNHVQGYGLEFETDYQFFKKYNLKGNVTYQSFRQKGVQEGEADLLDGARVNNMPYFFANLGVNANYKKLFFKNDVFRAYWNYSYVHPYFLKRIPKDLEPQGFLQLWGQPQLNTSLYIEKQNMHATGFVWIPNRSKQFSIGFDVKNVFDQKVYDNFKIQNAGRSFHCKLTYSIDFLNL